MAHTAGATPPNPERFEGGADTRVFAPAGGGATGRSGRWGRPPLDTPMRLARPAPGARCTAGDARVASRGRGDIAGHVVEPDLAAAGRERAVEARVRHR